STILKRTLDDSANCSPVFRVLRSWVLKRREMYRTHARTIAEWLTRPTNPKTTEVRHHSRNAAVATNAARTIIKHTPIEPYFRKFSTFCNTTVGAEHSYGSQHSLCE